MKTHLVAMAVAAVLLVSVSLADNAFAKSETYDVKSIMETYKKAIFKAQKDFKEAIDNANTYTKNAAASGTPADEINAKSKDMISKARVDLKEAKILAQKEAKTSLSNLKASIKPTH